MYLESLVDLARKLAITVVGVKEVF